MVKRTKKVQDSEVFLLSFIGETVQVLTDFVLTASSVNENSMDGSISTEDVPHPLIIEGYMLDSDSNYVYIGSTPDQVTQAIKKNRIVFIQILDKSDPLAEIMDSLNLKNKKEMN